MAYNFSKGFGGAASGATAGSALGGWGAAAGAGLGLLGGFGEDPADKAAKYYDQVPGTLNKGYDPYVQTGKWSMDQLKQQYGNLVNDPGALIQKLGQGYQKSPGYDWRLKQGQGSISNANAAGGMAGTQQHLQQAGQLGENLASDDFNNYLKNALGLYGQGVEGLSGLNQQGYNANNELTTSLAQALMTQGNLAYTGGQDQNEEMGQGLDLFTQLGKNKPWQGNKMPWQ